MEYVAIFLSLFSIAVSITTFLAVMALLTKRETGATIPQLFTKPEDTPNNVPQDTDTAELDNFVPNLKKPVSVKFL